MRRHGACNQTPCAEDKATVCTAVTAATAAVVLLLLLLLILLLLQSAETFDEKSREGKSERGREREGPRERERERSWRVRLSTGASREAPVDNECLGKSRQVGGTWKS